VGHAAQRQEEYKAKFKSYECPNKMLMDPIKGRTLVGIVTKQEGEVGIRVLLLSFQREGEDIDSHKEVSE